METTNERYFKEKKDVIQYLNDKGLQFIAEHVQSAPVGERAFINEWCVMESKSGFVFEVGIYGDFAPFGGKYIPVFKSN